MSEKLFLRRCRQHRMNLEEAVDHLICPFPPPDGHVCEDFVVIDRKTGAIVNEVPEDEAAAPVATPPGARDVVRSLAGGQLAKKEPKPMPVKTEKPHGTPGRYWQGCRCQPCKDAVNEHVKVLKSKREGKVATPRPRMVKAPKVDRRIHVPANRRPTSVATLVAEIEGLREQLAGREAELAAAVSLFLSTGRGKE